MRMKKRKEKSCESFRRMKRERFFQSTTKQLTGQAHTHVHYSKTSSALLYKINPYSFPLLKPPTN